MSADLRQQTIIDERHLLPLIGRTLHAISWRRSAGTEAFLTGSADLTVRLGATAAIDSLSASRDFAQNLGSNAVTVFAGVATAPASPATPGPTVPWSPDRTIRVAFQTPFVYAGGTLVVDVVGTARPGQSTPWWVADCAWDFASGATASVGTACGTHVNNQGEWAWADAFSLVPGASAVLSATGTFDGFALLVLGAPATAPGMPLQLLLPGARPNCEIYVPQPFQMVLTMFSSHLLATQAYGTANQILPIPNLPWALGAGFGTQWMDLGDQFATSNAVNCTVAATRPSLGMAHIRGAAAGALGQIAVNQAHVVRFEAQ
jgi:hypothetical protein